MSLGYSVGDFITIGQLCWNVYKACKGATGEYEEISKELSTLHTCLKELGEEAESPTSILNRRGFRRKDDMDNILSNISGVLKELEDMVLKYRSLGKMEKRKWDRLRFGAEHLDTMRGKLTYHTSAINLFMNSLTAGSLARIEVALEELIVEIRAGRRSPTVLSVQDEATESPDAWRELEAELLDSGVTKKDIERNRDAIRSYIKSLISDEVENVDLLPNDPISSSIAEFLGDYHDSAVSEKFSSVSQRILKEDKSNKKDGGRTSVADSKPITDSDSTSNADPTPIANPTPITDLPITDSTLIPDSMSIADSTPMANPTTDTTPIADPAPIADSAHPIINPTPIADSVPISFPTIDPAPIADSTPIIDPGSDPTPIADPIADPTSIARPTTHTTLSADPAPIADPIIDPTPIADLAGERRHSFHPLPERFSQALASDQTSGPPKEPSGSGDSLGFEVMGTVLSTWHVLLKTLALYKGTKGGRGAGLLQYELKTEEIIFTNLVRHLLASDVSDGDLIQLSDRRRPKGGLWRDKALASKLQRRLGNDKSEVVLKTLREMDVFLTCINDKLGGRNIDMNTPREKLNTGVAQLKNNLSSSSLRQDLENLRRHNTQLQRLLLSDCKSSGYLDV